MRQGGWLLGGANGYEAGRVGMGRVRLHIHYLWRVGLFIPIFTHYPPKLYPHPYPPTIHQNHTHTHTHNQYNFTRLSSLYVKPLPKKNTKSIKHSKIESDAN